MALTMYRAYGPLSTRSRSNMSNGPLHRTSYTPPGGTPDPRRSAPPDDIDVLRDLRKEFGDREVLKGINLVARRSETTVIIGGSGAGKTTLLRHIIGLERPDSGHIWVDGEDIVGMGDRELNRVRQKFGM